ELGPEPGAELTVRQGFLARHEVVADLDDAFQGLLDLLPNAVGAGAGLLSDRGFEQIIVEPDDDHFALRLLRHGCGPPRVRCEHGFVPSYPKLLLAARSGRLGEMRTAGP